ncbi:uncharacterized protein LOC129248006 [Anastrepha obliqua]|uniref:uncharacterized protein LOC129248006 n=1 Tax=Anastrepha obliqua TaxID=95512 RepID=UPI00240A5484|nr:uncharacterized protein LOC129248006 [Anastrepha obliqua]
MISDVLALFVVSVLLISCTNGSAANETKFVYVDHEQLNDSSLMRLKDLRNEVQQGDAVTFELGTPQYQILNPDEPPEIITSDQPGYYESLQRYEKAMKRQKSDLTKSSAEKSFRDQQVTEKQESQASLKDKKIKFIILNSKKKGKAPKIFLDVSKTKQQKYATSAEIRDNDRQIKSKKTKYFKVSEKYGVPQSTYSLPSYTTEKSLPMMQEAVYDRTTQSTIPGNPKNQAISKIQQPALQSQPMFLPYKTQSSGMTSLPPHSDLEALYAAEASANNPYYADPPHIRDFEYLYREALHMK